METLARWMSNLVVLVLFLLVLAFGFIGLVGWMRRRRCDDDY